MAVYQEHDDEAYRFVVRPNCALSWQKTKCIAWFFAACLFAVAIYFATLGAWMVFPFAGLELGVLVAGLYLSAVAGHTREVIIITGPILRVMQGRGRLEEVASFPANWTQVTLQRDPRGWYPSRLLLRCHGKVMEVGSKLVETEREELATSLRDILSFRLSPTVQSGLEDHAQRCLVTARVESVPPLTADVQAMAKISLASVQARAAGSAAGAYTKK